MQCFECDAPAEHDHHVIPRARGGTRTIPLCGRCHGLVHDAPQLSSTSALTRASMERMRAEGRYTGGEVMLGLRRRSDNHATVEPCSSELDVIRRILELSARGLSIRAIAATLTEGGQVLRGRVTFGKVQRVLTHWRLEAGAPMLVHPHADLSKLAV